VSWEPPADWTRLSVIDAHTAGEPLRVVTAGFPELPGETILARRRHAREHCDHLRRALMLEPRGHADMYGAVLTPPTTADGDVGVLFLHNEGYSTMCGHGIIGLVKVGLDCDLFAELGVELEGDPPRVRFDTPAGRVTATAHLSSGRVERVSFENVPSFLLARDLEVTVEGLGPVPFDVAYGGAFYAYVDAAAVGLEVEPARLVELVEAGRRIKAAVAESVELAHPSGDPELGFLYGTIFSQPGRGDARWRNACVFADGEVDRSPTGTGVSGRAAQLHARGELSTGERLRIESLLGTSFEVRVLRETRVGDTPAVVPEVEGSAWVTGRAELLIDPADPLREGFLLR